MLGAEIQEWIQWKQNPLTYGAHAWSRDDARGLREIEPMRERGRERRRERLGERERERYRSTAWMITNFNTNITNSDPPVKFVIHLPNHLPVQHPPVNTIVNIDIETITIAPFWDAKIGNNAHDIYPNEWCNYACGNKQIFEEFN